MYFLFFNHRKKTANYELTQSSVRDCSDVGKIALSDEGECKIAASELSLRYNNYGSEGSRSNNPKGCFYFDYRVRWNSHQTGSNRDHSQGICRTDSKNNTTQQFPCHHTSCK